MRKLCFFLSVLFCLFANAQHVVEHDQVKFPDSIPAGGYSGITWLGGDDYAVVTDNAATDGYFLFRIKLDSIGRISSAANLGFKGGEGGASDCEDVAWVPQLGTLFVTGEKDKQIRELSFEGKATGRKLPLPEAFKGTSSAYGIEALSYNAVTHRFWTTSESTLACDGVRANATNGVANNLRLISFDDDLKPVRQYHYVMDVPTAEVQPQNYAIGVSAITALDDGRLLVLEREFAVLESKIGSYVNCKIYIVNPKDGQCSDFSDNILNVKPLEKTLLAEWMTAIGLLDFSIANYEGMCLGPRLQDGGQVIVLVADSQNQYGGILSDWLKTFVIYF